MLYDNQPKTILQIIEEGLQKGMLIIDRESMTEEVYQDNGEDLVCISSAHFERLGTKLIFSHTRTFKRVTAFDGIGLPVERILKLPIKEPFWTKYAVCLADFVCPTSGETFKRGQRFKVLRQRIIVPHSDGKISRYHITTTLGKRCAPCDSLH